MTKLSHKMNFSLKLYNRLSCRINLFLAKEKANKEKIL